MDGHSILVVEDNPDDQVLAVRALKSASENSPVIVLEDGQEALDFLFGQVDQLSGVYGTNEVACPLLAFCQ